MNHTPTGQWTTIKPAFNEECVFVTASMCAGYWCYTVGQIEKIKGPDGWYLGWLDGNGVEVGDINELEADMYMILPKKGRNK